MARPFKPGKLETYKNWLIRGRGTYRAYVSAVSPDNKRSFVFSTVRAAREFISSQERLC